MVAPLSNLGDPHFGGETQPLIEKRPSYANRSLAADLAVSPRNIQFIPEYRRVEVTVHNIGAIPARSLEVAI